MMMMKMRFRYSLFSMLCSMMIMMLIMMMMKMRFRYSLFSTECFMLVASVVAFFNTVVNVSRKFKLLFSSIMINLSIEPIMCTFFLMSSSLSETIRRRNQFQCLPQLFINKLIMYIDFDFVQRPLVRQFHSQSSSLAYRQENGLHCVTWFSFSQFLRQTCCIFC